MKKICYVVTLPLTIRAFFIPQIRYLAESGFEVCVVCSPDPNLQNELGEKVCYIPIEIPRGISFGGSLRAIRQMRSFFKREKFDMVQYSTPNAAFYAAIAAKQAGIRVRNYHLMGLRFLGERGVKRSVLKMLEGTACRYSTSVECVSKSNLEMCVKYGLVPEEKVTVVWNGSTGGVDTHRFDYAQRELWRQQIRQQLGYGPDELVFGFVGRITKDKGINELLRAFKDMNRQGKCKLLVIGDVEGAETLDQELFSQAQADSDVKFHGFVRDIERYYAAIDTLVLPSYREGFGNVIIESAAVGTPAIVSSIPGPIDAVIPEETALLVPAKDGLALMQAMEKVAAMDYKAFGERAYRYVKDHFDSGRLNEKILERKRLLTQQQ